MSICVASTFGGSSDGSLPTCPPSSVRAATETTRFGASNARPRPSAGGSTPVSSGRLAWPLPRSDRTRVSIEQAEEAPMHGDVPGRPGPIPPARGRPSDPPSSPWWAPARTHRRLLIVQIDGLSWVILDRALASGRMPFLKRLLARGGHRLEPMSVGLPTSTAAFQMAAMFGVRPDIPAFHYYDRQRRGDIHFPRPR